MNCPRCDVPLDPPPEDLANAPARDAPDLAHRCHRCMGEWVAGDHVHAVFPALRHHARRMGELTALGANEAGATCPTCVRPTLEFPFFDLWLDLCDRCHGIWVDGHETDFVSVAARDEHGLPSQRSASYRSAVQAQASLVSCTGCEKLVHPRRTLLTGEGAICDNCVQIDRMSEALQDTSSLSSVKSAPRKLIRWLSRVLDMKGKHDSLGHHR